jgi:hypothetical protein
MEFGYTYEKEIDSQKLSRELAQASIPAPLRIDTVGSQVIIVFDDGLSNEQHDALSAIVNGHIKLTTAESLTIYLDSQVFPFITNLIRLFAAENIAMGITQAGKAGHVLALFSKPVAIPNEHFQCSLKNSFDTGSLYVSLDIIEFFRNNPNEFDGLSPFVTDARLLAMKNKIEQFLGLTLSE